MTRCRPKINYLLKTILLLFLSLLSLHTYAQTVITGKVISDKNEPLPGVGVVLKGTTTGITTDLDGTYTLKVNASNGVLVFSYIGFITQEIPINSKSEINVSLVEDLQALSEVVVVGYGTVKKSDVTGAVQKVEGAKLQQVATSDPLQALQGRAAGVQIVNNSGAPAAGMKVMIRGVGSVNSSDPLYVVDGFPTNDISNIPPSDIESMEVLKDASATAIYGSRGANGIIMVTTKRGKEGKTKFSFNSYYGAQEAWKRVDMLNASQYSELLLESYANGGKALDGSTKEKLDFVLSNNSNGTNWQEELFRVGRVQNYSLGINGGNDIARYNVSGTYFRNDGIVESTYLQKGFTRANFDLKLSEKISSGLNLTYTVADYTPFNVSPFSGPLANALKKDPLTAPKDASGNWDRSGTSDNPNPARLISEERNRVNKDYRIVGGGFVKIDLLKGLSFTSQVTYDRTDGFYSNYLPKFSITNNEERPMSILAGQTNARIRFVNSNFLNLSKTFNKHNVNATIGLENSYFKNTALELLAFDVPENEATRYIVTSRTPENLQVNFQQDSRYKILSYFGRLNYSFDDRYLLTGTLRYDGSSKFKKDNRWGLFPSFGAGWNIHNEEFFPENNILSTAKLRAGWGKVGNEATVAPYSYLTTFVDNWVYALGNGTVTGSIPVALANPNIHWEESKTTNVGVELGLLRNRLSLNADYFIRETLEMLVRQPTPGFAGASGGTANIGDLRNQGIELQMEYRGNINELKYSVSANATHVRNKITNLGGASPMEAGSESRVGGATNRTEEGREIGYFYGLKTDGIFNSKEEIDGYINSKGTLIQPKAKPGDVKFVDVNPDGEINFASDRTYLGSAIPDLTYGFSTRFDIKGFDLNILFQGSYGNEIANMMTFYSENTSAIENSFATRYNRWTPENPSSNEPRVSIVDENKNNDFSDRYVENGSYLRLKNLQLGYTLPASIVKRFSVGSLRVYVSTDNIHTWTKYSGLDPEIGNYNSDPLQPGVDYGSYPQARTFIGGFKLIRE